VAVVQGTLRLVLVVPVAALLVEPVLVVVALEQQTLVAVGLVVQHRSAEASLVETVVRVL
jgi:hypothetical protein